MKRRADSWDTWDQMAKANEMLNVKLPRSEQRLYQEARGDARQCLGDGARSRSVFRPTRRGTVHRTECLSASRAV